MIKYPTSAVRCRQISDPTQLSVISVIFIWCCIHPWHPWCHVQFHPHPSALLPNFPSPQCVADKFPISHIMRDIRDVNDRLHPYSSPLWSNLPSPQCVAESWHMNIQFLIPAGRGTIMTLDIKFPISAGRRRIMMWTRNFHIKVFDLRSASQDHTV